MTNFGGKAAYEGGSEPGPRGVMGNAQTHCVQLPNTFAFSRGAEGKSLTEADYVLFANDLIPGRGRLIVNGWQALSGKDPIKMRGAAKELSGPNGKVICQLGPSTDYYFVVTHTDSSTT